MENDNLKLKKEEILAEKIGYDDFVKVEMKAGQILSAEKVPETDKLVKLSVDFGSFKTEVKKEDGTVEIQEAKDVRQIISGISLYFPDASVLVGKKCMFVTNLEPRKIKGLESNGMILALSTEDGKFSLLEPSAEIPIGTKAK
ncbi:MAG: hypothetical protein WC250_00405 [Candidatus Paceibacterota bacterium]|jgi:methionyl-tRNA synthetase